MTVSRPPLPDLSTTDHAGTAAWLRGLAAALAWPDDMYSIVAAPPDGPTCRLATLSTDSLTLAIVRTPYGRLELHIRDSAATIGRNHVYAEAWLRSPHALAEHLSHRFQGPARRALLHTAA